MPSVFPLSAWQLAGCYRLKSSAAIRRAALLRPAAGLGHRFAGPLSSLVSFRPVQAHRGLPSAARLTSSTNTTDRAVLRPVGKRPDLRPGQFPPSPRTLPYPRRRDYHDVARDKLRAPPIVQVGLMAGGLGRNARAAFAGTEEIQ